MSALLATSLAPAPVDALDHAVIARYRQLRVGFLERLIGAYLALFPNARLGIVVPLGLWLEFIRLPAIVLIGVWALLQWLFTFLGPAFGHVAWWAHVSGFIAGIIIALIMRPFIKIPRLR